jgi:5-formyltetrahydrofolate cyclo-ligase
MSDNDLASRKAELRKRLSADRKALANELKSQPAKAHELRRNYLNQLRELCHQFGAKRLTCYLPFGGEPDTSAFITWALQAGISVLLPVANADNTMHWVEFDGVTTKSSIFGFDEPHGPTAQLDPIDLIIVPALAVDQRGNRLGKGKGYYDRALAEASAPVIAVVYEHELLEALPAEVHDRAVNFVVTEARTLKLG